MTVFVFPGQGSQTKGMGSGLFDEFEELTAKADDVLGYSIKKLCLEDPDQQLSQTRYTQPALYIINAFSYLRRIKETGKRPDYVAGHSLGEYNALFSAGAWPWPPKGLLRRFSDNRLLSRSPPNQPSTAL